MPHSPDISPGPGSRSGSILPGTRDSDFTHDDSMLAITQNHGRPTQDFETSTGSTACDVPANKKETTKSGFTATEKSSDSTPVTLTGFMTVNSVEVIRNKGILAVNSVQQYNGIPMLAISLLDLANAADFPANVFNEIPVPTFAVVLMAIGGIFATVMSVVALVDAKRSWHNMRLLHDERRALLAIKATNDETDDEGRPNHGSDFIMLSLNKRDTRVEFFERAGMETMMGVAAFCVGVGTFLAIGGVVPQVFEASNLLSGYIGNSPTALYGVVNVIWSCTAWRRARRQRMSALSRLRAGRVHDALKARTSSIERHAILSGATCLISGALGPLTVTQWQPYPVLLVAGLLFIYSTWVFRNRVNYIRPLMHAGTHHFVADEIIDELDRLLFIQQSCRKEKTFLSKACFGDNLDNSFAHSFGLVVGLGLFEEFTRHVLADGILNMQLQNEWRTVHRRLAPGDFLSLDYNLHPTLNSVAKQCMAKAGPRHIAIRTRFLLEALGTCLITASDAASVHAPSEKA